MHGCDKYFSFRFISKFGQIPRNSIHKESCNPSRKSKSVLKLVSIPGFPLMKQFSSKLTRYKTYRESLVLILRQFQSSSTIAILHIQCYCCDRNCTYDLS